MNKSQMNFRETIKNLTDDEMNKTLSEVKWSINEERKFNEMCSTKIEQLKHSKKESNER